MVLGAAAVVLSGKAGDVIHRVKGLAVGAAGPAIEPEQEVEDSINRTAGASACTVTAKAIEAMYQPGDAATTSRSASIPRVPATACRARSPWLISAGGTASS